MGQLGGGSGGKGGFTGGLSDADIQAIMGAMGENIQAITNRYHQLGLGVPSGSPIDAAKSGTSLQYAGPSTMEQQDIQGQNLEANAALGQLQNQNLPAAAQSAGNLGSTLGQIAGIAGTAGMFA
jgi:hypothetical protein